MTGNACCCTDYTGGGLTFKVEHQIAGRIFIAVCCFEIYRKNLWNVIKDTELTVRDFVYTGLRLLGYVKE